jgi:hypothetical protein
VPVIAEQGVFVDLTTTTDIRPGHR